MRRGLAVGLVVLGFVIGFVLEAYGQRIISP
jgi:hypothetical protein